MTIKEQHFIRTGAGLTAPILYYSTDSQFSNHEDRWFVAFNDKAQGQELLWGTTTLL